jgi:hypothetical protein
MKKRLSDWILFLSGYRRRARAACCQEEEQVCHIIGIVICRINQERHILGLCAHSLLLHYLTTFLPNLGPFFKSPYNP